MATIDSELFLVFYITKEAWQVIPGPLNVGFLTLIKDSKERWMEWG